VLNKNLDWLHGKIIDHIDCSKYDEFVVIHFTDGTVWLLVAERWNCAGAKFIYRFG
jgi:predicted KAP-like P-loop ATPase